GFYLYENGRSAGTNPEALNLIPSRQITTRPGDAWRRIRDAIIREAELARDEGVASESDIDTAVRLAMNFPKGPFELRREREAGA
ncbi:MAG TPA: 3-hydroxyacyl-CoA dehydrogenase family protein, partial [Elusimicrobiota bacterium]|nr:3-hydroxyacyl-CoA dehydrogenase family protein [Elusimicrobiota bacterium]